MKQDCNTLQQNVTLQHTMWHCNTLQHTLWHCNTMQHTLWHCNTLQHARWHCNTHSATGLHELAIPLILKKYSYTHWKCMYIYIAYIHIHIHAHAYTYSIGLHELEIPLILKHMHTHLYVNVYACIHIYIPMYIYISTYKYVLKLACTNLLKPWLIPKPIHTHKSMYAYTNAFIYTYPPDPMNHANIFKGWSSQDAPSELVPQWYKTFPPDHFGRVEMKKPTRFSNKTNTAWSCAEDQILENKIPVTGFWIFVMNDK